jgi:2-phosphosulfolactate phosphatase
MSGGLDAVTAESIGDATIYGQADYSIRFEWGLDGARAAGAGVDAIVVVDVLSFTTAVSVAVEHGATVFPYRWQDESAQEFAAAKGALLAGSRGQGNLSLSPVSMAKLGEGTRVVLPSPNGATICTEIANRGVRVIAGSIRNAAAVAAHANEHGCSLAVIGAGEHWRGSSGMRPCLEDLLGAGAVLSGLDESRCSPEARSAIGAYRHVAHDLTTTLRACAGGRELEAWGYPEDVTMAADLNADACVPLLSAGGYFAGAS